MNNCISTVAGWSFSKSWVFNHWQLKITTDPLLLMVSILSVLINLYTHLNVTHRIWLRFSTPFVGHFTDIWWLFCESCAISLGSEYKRVSRVWSSNECQLYRMFFNMPHGVSASHMIITDHWFMSSARHLLYLAEFICDYTAGNKLHVQCYIFNKAEWSLKW